MATGIATIIIGIIALVVALGLTVAAVFIIGGLLHLTATITGK